MNRSLPTSSKIDQICLSYESQLGNKGSLGIRKFLTEIDGNARAELFRELLLVKWAFENDAASPESDLAEFPEYEALVRECRYRFERISPQRLLAGDHIGQIEIRGSDTDCHGFHPFEAWDDEASIVVHVKRLDLGCHPTRERADKCFDEASRLARFLHTNLQLPRAVLRDRHGWPLVVFDPVTGPNLFDAQHRLEFVIRSLIEASRGLQTIHDQEVFHRNLTPSCIRIQDGNRVIVTGIESSGVRRNSWSTKSADELQCMSPELMCGGFHWSDGRADIWSLGCILYQAVTGCPAFNSTKPDALRGMILNRSVTPPRQLNPACPRDLEQICLRCLAKSPSDRYDSVGQLGEALARCFSKESRTTTRSYRQSLKLMARWPLRS